MERHDEDQRLQKKRYEKPEVKRFPLRPEEAVLGFCKSNSSGNSSPACAAVTCKTHGS
jgi:hypothetical protein